MYLYETVLATKTCNVKIKKNSSKKKPNAINCPVNETSKKKEETFGNSRLF